jgi:GxxExxY protein
MENRFMVERRKSLAVVYPGLTPDIGYRLDLLVNEQVIVEMRAVGKLGAIRDGTTSLAPKAFKPLISHFDLP